MAAYLVLMNFKCLFAAYKVAECSREMDKQKEDFNEESVYGSTSIADRFNLFCAIANRSAPFTACPLPKHSREDVRTNIEQSNKFGIQGFGKIIPVWQSARREIMEK